MYKISKTHEKNSTTNKKHELISESEKKSEHANSNIPQV
jgi:hypothetical protein